MPATCYVIALMMCSASEPCETIALRAVHYRSHAQCQEAVPDALRVVRRLRPDGADLTARCRDLAEVCPSRVATANAPAGQLQLVRNVQVNRSSSAIDAVLAVLCAPPPDQGGGATDCLSGLSE